MVRSWVPQPTHWRRRGNDATTVSGAHTVGVVTLWPSTFCVVDGMQSQPVGDAERVAPPTDIAEVIITAEVAITEFNR